MDFESLLTSIGVGEGDVAVLAVALMIAAVMGSYIYRLRASLRAYRQRLDEQSRFVRKLNSTVDRLLKIEEDGSIDSNRRSRK